MNRRLADSVAVVTGAASGIGKAVAHRLTEEGAEAVLADIDGEAGLSTVAEIKASGRRASFFEVDVSSRDEILQFARSVARNHKDISILVNNAGIAEWAPIAGTSEAMWDQVLRTNLESAFYCTQAFLDQLVAQQGAIINVASASALVGMKWQAAYAASKGGMVAMTRSMAAELGPTGVRVNAVCPGAIDTAIMGKALVELPDSSREAMALLSPLGRYGSSEDVAEAILYLAGTQARFITGTCLTIDGGMTAV